MIALKKHRGIVLEPTSQSFDEGASTFCCLFKETDDDCYYLYYTGSVDLKWTKTSIGVAKSQDGVNFVKFSGNPILSVGKQAVTPALFKAKGRYWMAFAFKPDEKRGRRIGIATADDPLGPWKFIKQLIRPEMHWEGNGIDIGPSIISLNEETHFVLYSMVSNNRPLDFIFGPRDYRRHIGILRIKILGSNNVEAERWCKNPLNHLNNTKGSWNESLFCPGYFSFGENHYLLPAASTYSVGFPWKQYIGLVEDISPFFERPHFMRILINGPEEKKMILPNVVGEIALDTPSPLLRRNELWLYYAVMDRDCGVWKTALSTFSIG